MEKEKIEFEIPEIKEIKERIEKAREEIEKKPSPEEKEKIIKEEIKKYLVELQKTPSFAPPLSSRDELKEIVKLEREQQIGVLISLVFEKGLEKAVSLAKALGNPAILDEFHDTLVDRYYQILVERGILKF